MAIDVHKKKVATIWGHMKRNWNDNRWNRGFLCLHRVHLKFVECIALWLYRITSQQQFYSRHAKTKPHITQTHKQRTKRENGERERERDKSMHYNKQKTVNVKNMHTKVVCCRRIVIFDLLYRSCVFLLLHAHISSCWRAYRTHAA